MKRLLLSLLMIPSFLWGQDDSRYLANAVPVENGKVTFSKEIKAPTLSENQIYETILSWAKNYFTFEDSRIVYAEQKEGDIAVVAENYLIFQNTALSLDRAMMKYRVMINCKDHLCTIKINNIRYDYSVSYQREPEKYTAEEWITDKYALNKNYTKLNRGNGKFREKTIDLVDAIFKEAEAALGIQVSQSSVASTTPSSQPAVRTTPAMSLPATTASKAGYSSFTGNNIPGTLLQLLPESKLRIVAKSNNEEFETTGTWKGIGNMFGKSIASATISNGSNVYKSLSDNEPYSISFFKSETEKEPWFIIECSKQGETTDGSEVTLMGEIINVWIK